MALPEPAIAFQKGVIGKSEATAVARDEDNRCIQSGILNSGLQTRSFMPI